MVSEMAAAEVQSRVAEPSLTKTDRKIVALVADGMTSVEVCSRIFVSPHSGSLTRVLAKLGVR